VSRPREPVERVERLWPSVSIWLATLVMAGFCAVVALPFGAVPGAVTFVVSVLVMAGLLISATPRVGVRDGEFLAGRAHLPVTLIGEMTELEGARLRHAHGPGLDARAHLCIRGWVRTGLRLDLIDPQDPTPYWLVSCRHPEAMLEAIERSRRPG
jgi:Protein of unknown function (DUF3093)